MKNTKPASAIALLDGPFLIRHVIEQFFAACCLHGARPFKK
jgi:hypothetical protein